MVMTVEAGSLVESTFSPDPIVPKFPILKLAEAEQYYLLFLFPHINQLAKLLQQFRYGYSKVPMETTLLRAFDNARLQAIENSQDDKCDKWFTAWSKAIQAVDQLEVGKNGTNPKIAVVNPFLEEVRKAAGYPYCDVAANVVAERTAQAIKTNTTRLHTLDHPADLGAIPQQQLFSTLNTLYHLGTVNIQLANVDGKERLVAHLPTLTPEGNPALACLVEGDHTPHAQHPWSVYCRNLHPFPGNPQPPRKIYALEALR